MSKENKKELELDAEQYVGILTKQLDYGFSLLDRVVYLEEEIDIMLPSYIKERIAVIEELSDKKGEPVTLEITSFGGDVYATFAVVDVLRQAKVPINTLGRGGVMSGAALILAAGTGKRRITPNTIVMVHEISSWFGGSSKDIFSEADNLKFLQDRMYQLLADFTSKDSDFWRDKTKSTCYLNAENCIEYGLVDEILEPPTKDERKGNKNKKN